MEKPTLYSANMLQHTVEADLKADISSQFPLGAIKVSFIHSFKQSVFFTQKCAIQTDRLNKSLLKGTLWSF